MNLAVSVARPQETLASYGQLERRFERIYLLRDAGNVLQWDMATMMPRGGAPARAEQLAMLKVVGHELITDPAMAELLEQAEAETGCLDPWQQANLREMRREWIHAVALPASLVAALSKAGSHCEMVWRTARPASDFRALLPSFEEVLRLVREAAAIKGARLGLAPYDALLDEYEPGLTGAEIDPVFAQLGEFLPGFLDRVLERQGRGPEILPLQGPFPADKQRQLALKVMGALGFNFNHGRLDTSDHPFCGGVPDDLRLTTRWDAADFASGLMGVIHETGHALYEAGLPAEWRHQPVGQPRSMGIHESQSLLLEMQACRSRQFIQFLTPLAAETMGGKGAAWEPDNIYRLYTRVRRSLIRVDADEVTYPLHVILRYRLERALIAGDLALADLPAAWNDGMRQALGVTPPSDRDGCLQDVHWPAGLWGYFPTYTLGAIKAAQIFAAAVAEEGSIPEAIAAGDFQPLVAWLRAHLHGRGSLFTTRQLLVAATGRPLDPSSFIRHLETRYLS